MTDIQTLEILDVLKSLPAEKIDEVKDFAVFLRERYGESKEGEIFDESDEWSEEDLRDASNASLSYADEVTE